MELSEINLRQTALILKSHGEYFFDSSWRSDAPLETQSRLFFIQDGEMYYKIKGKDYVVSKNQLALIPENRHVKFGVSNTRSSVSDFATLTPLSETRAYSTT